MGLLVVLFFCSQFRHLNMFPAHSIVHYPRSTGDLMSFVLRVPGLNEGVMFGGKALGLMAGPLIWMLGAPGKRSLQASCCFVNQLCLPSRRVFGHIPPWCNALEDLVSNNHQQTLLFGLKTLPNNNLLVKGVSYCWSVGKWRWILRGEC